MNMYNNKFLQIEIAHCYMSYSTLSGRQDSNLRPPHPKCGAITGLRYAPKFFSVTLPKVAERVGVEPTVQFNPYDDLANRSFRPLRHLSLIQLFKGGKNTLSI